MPDDSELEDEDFDAQFQQKPEEDEEPEPEVLEETTEEVEEEPEETETQEDSGEDEEELDKPVSEGEIVELEIEDLGSKGDGIARKEGFVIFVPGGEVDQTYDVEITSVGRKFAFGEIAE